MKTLLLSAALCASAHIVASQNNKDLAFYPRTVTEGATGNTNREPEFTVQPVSNRPVTAEQLHNARRLSDFISQYPRNWITQYLSTDISVTREGRTLSAPGENERLTAKQSELLASAGLSDEVTVRIAYLYNNSITHRPEKFTMNMRFTLLPHIQATFPGGYPQLIRSLKASSMDRIMGGIPAAGRRGTVRFTVTASGRVTGARITVSSGRADMDLILLDAVDHMPDWIPAKDAGGHPVKQDFELRVSDFTDC